MRDGIDGWVPGGGGGIIPGINGGIPGIGGIPGGGTMPGGGPRIIIIGPPGGSIIGGIPTNLNQ